jgi:protein SCO1/2
MRRLLGGLLLASLAGCLACKGGEPLPRIAEVPQFQLRDQNGRELRRDALRGKVWVANFMFSRCPDVCPLLTGKMKGLRTELLRERSHLRFVSFSVDPEHDTPAVLKKFAQEHGADQPDWSFLTGPLQLIQDIVIKGFKQTLAPEPEQAGKAYSILHGSHFVLVDRGLSIRGYYPSDENGLLRLARDARVLVAEKAPGP